MNTKKIVFALVACISLMAVSCTSDASADDALYENENSVEKSRIRAPKHG